MFARHVPLTGIAIVSPVLLSRYWHCGAQTWFGVAEDAVVEATVFVGAGELSVLGGGELFAVCCGSILQALSLIALRSLTLLANASNSPFRSPPSFSGRSPCSCDSPGLASTTEEAAAAMNTIAVS